MTTDLVTRLRTLAKQEDYYVEICGEAADRIEELERREKLWKEYVDYLSSILAGNRIDYSYKEIQFRRELGLEAPNE